MRSEKTLELIGERFAEADDLSGDGMAAQEVRGMKRKAPGKRAYFRAVQVIAGNRTSDMRQMDADLMRASGFKPQPKQGAIAPRALDAVMRDGALPVLSDNPACAGTGTGDRRVDDALRLLRDSL